MSKFVVFLVVVLSAILAQAFMPTCRTGRGQVHMRVGPNNNGNKLKTISVVTNMREHVAATRKPNQLMFSNLPFELTNEELRAFASKAGDVAVTRIIADKDSGKSKGYGFVHYKDPLHAAYAMDKLNGWELNGRTVDIKPAVRKAAGESTSD